MKYNTIIANTLKLIHSLRTNISDRLGNTNVSVFEVKVYFCDRCNVN